MSLTSAVGRTAQIGVARQTAGAGTPIVPTSSSANTSFMKFQSGSKVRPQSTIVREFEGDGQRGQGLQTKKAQWGMGKLITLARPNDLAYLLGAFCGAGSDTVTAPVAPAVNSGHAIVPASSNNNDYFTIVQNLAGGYLRQVSDAICTKLVLSASKDAPWLKADSDWMGTTTTQSGAVTSAQFQPNMPFLFFGVNFSNPIASLNGALQALTITLDAPATMTDFQTESVTGNPLKAANIVVTFDISVLWQDGGAAAYAYYGSTAGLTDAIQLPMGALAATFQCQDDTTQTTTLTLPNAAFDEDDFEPDPSGKPVIQKITGGSIRTAGNPAFSAVVTCTGAAKYSS